MNMIHKSTCRTCSFIKSGYICVCVNIFRFLVSVDALVCAFSVVSLMCVYVLRRSESYRSDAQLANKHFLLFLHDTVHKSILAVFSIRCAFFHSIVSLLSRISNKSVTSLQS